MYQPEITPFEQIILSQMPRQAFDSYDVDDEILLKAAYDFQKLFSEDIAKFENNGRSEVFRPNMKPHSQRNAIDKILCELTGKYQMPSKTPSYQVLFIVGTLWSIISPSWWEETFTKRTWEYLEMTADFKDSKSQMKQALAILKIGTNDKRK